MVLSFFSYSKLKPNENYKILHGKYYLLYQKSYYKNKVEIVVDLLGGVSSWSKYPAEVPAKEICCDECSKCVQYLKYCTRNHWYTTFSNSIWNLFILQYTNSRSYLIFKNCSVIRWIAIRCLKFRTLTYVSFLLTSLSQSGIKLTIN